VPLVEVFGTGVTLRTLLILTIWVGRFSVEGRMKRVRSFLFLFMSLTFSSLCP